MTQQETAVGGSNDTVVAAEPTIEDRFAAIAGDEQDDEEPEELADGGDQPPEQLAGDDAEAEPVDPAITPPVSLSAEEKEAFKTWPREAQEAISRRVGELEKGFQTKAQEAAKTRFVVEQQSAEWRTTKLQADAKLMSEMLPEIPEKPSHYLQLQDPHTYAQQMEWYESSVAQHNLVVQRYGEIQAEINQVQQTMRTQQNQLTQQILEEHFPDYLDQSKGPELKKSLASTAMAMGYSNDQLANVDAQDILAMKQANEWREDSVKYRALMSKQMQNVREAKKLPRVSRPGVAQGKGVVAGERYNADRQAMRNGDRDAGARVFSKFL